MKGNLVRREPGKIYSFPQSERIAYTELDGKIAPD